MTDTLSALLAPTRSMYGADAAAAPAAPVAAPPSPVGARAPAQGSSMPTMPTPETYSGPSVGVMVGGIAIATGVAAGVSALVGGVAYPETRTRQFAAVGALAYAIPATLLLGTSLAFGKKQRG
jgi:hypothetical protein